MTTFSVGRVRACDHYFSDDGLLKISLAFAFVCLFSFLIILFPTSASAGTLTPVSAAQTGDHRAPPPALATSSSKTLSMSPSPKTPLASGRVQRSAGSAVIISYLLGVRTVGAAEPSRRELALQRKAQQVVVTRRDTRSDQTNLAIATLKENWRWSR